MTGDELAAALTEHGVDLGPFSIAGSTEIKNGKEEYAGLVLRTRRGIEIGQGGWRRTHQNFDPGNLLVRRVDSNTYQWVTDLEELAREISALDPRSRNDISSVGE